MKLNTKIVVALISFAGAIGAALITHSCSKDEATFKDTKLDVGKNITTNKGTVVGDNAQVNNNTNNTLDVAKNIVTGRGSAAGDNAQVNNNTTNNNTTNIQNFYGLKPEDLEHITTLFPSNENTPRNVCDNQPHEPNTLTILLGTSAALTNRFPHTVLALGGESLLVVDRDGENGNLIIKTLRIYDKNDNRIAQIIGDGKLNKTFFNELYLRPDKHDLSTFSLYDRRDKEILKVRFLNSTTLSVQGIFRNHGAEAIITDNQMLLSSDFVNVTSITNCFAYNGSDIND